MMLSEQSLNTFAEWVAQYKVAQYKDDTELQRAHKEGKQTYKYVGKILADPQLTVYVFECAVGMLRSKGLLRQKNRWQGAVEELRSLVTYLSSPPSQESPGAIFHRALTLPPQGYKVAGVGPNLVSEILTVYHPQRYGIYNRRACNVIKEQLYGPGFHAGSNDGNIYENFLKLLNHLREKGELEDLMEVDTVLDSKYVEHSGS